MCRRPMERILATMIRLEAGGPRRFSRRNALLGTLAAAPFGCPGSPRGSAASAQTGDAAPPWGGLKVVRVSGMRDDERGGSAVVVLHGWGAAGDELVPRAEARKRPGVRLFVPAAPLPEIGGGRAWWHLDPNTRPPHAYSD